MATAVKRKLSGSTLGKPIKLTKMDTTDADLIHTSVDSTVAGTFDEIQLYAYNNHSASVVLTVEFGGKDVPDQNIVVTVPNKSGLVPVIPGLILQGNISITAFASVADVVTMSGFVNSITD